MRLYGQIDQRRVYIGAGADVLDQPLDVDITHAKSSSGGGPRFTRPCGRNP